MVLDGDYLPDLLQNKTVIPKLKIIAVGVVPKRVNTIQVPD
jgi:hypothetical protein